MKLYLTNFKDYLDEMRARGIKKSFYFLDNNTEPIKEIVEIQQPDGRIVKEERVKGITYTSFVRFTAQEIVTDGSGKAIETNLVSCMVTVFNKAITNNVESEAADKEILHGKDLKVTEFKSVLPKTELVEGVWVI
jgi:hypothetical protein